MGGSEGHPRKMPALRAWRHATAEEWDAQWRACPYATYYQSRAWSEDWAAYTHGWMKPEPMLLTFDDDRRALLPLIGTGRRPVRRYLMAPAGTYGGWLSADPLEPIHAEALVKWLLHERRPLWWRVNPFDPLVAVAARRATVPDVTHVVALDGYDEGRHKSHSSAVRRARRLGLRVRPARGADDWQAYYEIYAAALQRWGDDATSRYGPQLFELLRRRQGVELWVVEHPDGAIISGAIGLYTSSHVAVWHMATLAAHYQSRPTSLLEADLIVDARQRGLVWYDMCPSGGHHGVAEFKEHLGGRPLACPVVVTDALPAKVVGAIRRVGVAAARAALHGDARE